MIELDVTYQVDCLELMRTYEDNTFDLVLTDPPYGLGIAKSGSLSIKGVSDKRLEYTPSDWDVKPPREYFDEILRVSKDQIIWGGNYFTDYLLPSQCWLVWYKKAGLPAKTFADCELAWTSFSKPARVFNSRWHGFIRDSREPKLGVPTQKALALFEWCITNYTQPKALVLDPFAGSGTTAEACIKQGRQFVQCEIREDYYQIALERIQATKGDN